MAPSQPSSSTSIRGVKPPTASHPKKKKSVPVFILSSCQKCSLTKIPIGLLLHSLSNPLAHSTYFLGQIFWQLCLHLYRTATRHLIIGNLHITSVTVMDYRLGNIHRNTRFVAGYMSLFMPSLETSEGYYHFPQRYGSSSQSGAVHVLTEI